MAFRSPRWLPISILLSAVNLVSVGFAARAGEGWHAGIHAALALGFGLWAQHLAGRRSAAAAAQTNGSATGTGEPGSQAAAIEEMRATLLEQSNQIAELNERVDFAERVLAQVRDRPVMGNPEK